MLTDHQLAQRLAKLQPKTDDELRAIWERCPTDETRELLWEIKRLQDLVVSSEWYAVEMQTRYPAVAAHVATGMWVRKLGKEPCVVAEHERQRYLEQKRNEIPNRDY